MTTALDIISTDAQFNKLALNFLELGVGISALKSLNELDVEIREGNQERKGTRKISKC